MLLSIGTPFDDTPSPPRRLISIPAVRASLIFLTAFCACILYGHTYFYRDPGSIFYDESRAYERKYSSYREQQAESFMHSVAEYTRFRQREFHLPVFPKANENATMCAVFLTVNRDSNRQHLETSLGSILEGLTPAERADISVQVFFANVNPGPHPSWYKSWLRPLVDRAYTYADLYSFEAMADVLPLEQVGPLAVAKQPLDYAVALQQCHDYTRARYITVLEDDIVAADSWFARTMWAAREVEKRTWKEGRAGRWIYLRLFNQERSIGWGSRTIGGNHEAGISLGIASAMGAILLLMRRCLRPASKPILDKWTIAVICCVAVPSFVILFFQSGRASVLPPSPGIKDEFFGCCSQALVFNREHVPGLIDYIHGSARYGHYDMLTRDYAWQQKLARFSLYPVMTQHVGRQSLTPSEQTDHEEVGRVWSMAFESLSPKRLRHDHANFVKRLYGADAVI